MTFFGLDGTHVAIAAAGAIVILAYWLPRFVSNQEPAASFLLIVIGAVVFSIVPALPDVFDPRQNPKIWEIIAEIAVVAALFGTGLRIDDVRDPRRWSATWRLLAITMPLTIAAVALLGVLAAGLTVAAAILVGAVLSPTDPVLAGDVQVGPPMEGNEHPVRFTLTTEAGLNDGLAFPFVYLALAIAAGGFTESVFTDWVLVDLLWRIGMGAGTGIAIGWLLGRVMFIYPRGSVLADTTSGILALGGICLSYGITELVEGYGFIAVFMTGLTLRRAERGHGFHRRLHDFSQAIEHALTAAILVLLGCAMPALFRDLSVHHVAIGLALVFVIRPVAGWLALAGSAIHGRDRWVVAIYGVRGVGSIYYLAFAGGKVEFVNEEQLWALVGFVILLSTLVHGLTAGTTMERVAERAAENVEPSAQPASGRTPISR